MLCLLNAQRTQTLSRTHERTHTPTPRSAKVDPRRGGGGDCRGGGGVVRAQAMPLPAPNAAHHPRRHADGERGLRTV